MSAKSSSIVSKSLWTVGTYAASAGIRFSSNIVLSRVLGPEVMGIVVIAQAIRVGTELLTDLGLEQNVVHSVHGDDERFLNTIWTMQLLRGLIVSLACLCLTPLLAHLYRVDIALLMVLSAVPILNSMMSTSIFSVSRRLDVKTRNLFELSAEAAGLLINVTLALTLRSVWAPIISILLAIAVRSSLTYLLPHPKHRLLLDRSHAVAIFHFSKWIMLSSLTFFAAAYVDRLFLGRVVSLGTLGVYGLAKAVADLPNVVAGRLAFQVVFPFVAAQKDGLVAGGVARAELGRARRNFLLLVMVGVGSVMAWSDWAVHILYGAQYKAAGWMLCMLLIGGWMAVVCSLNEATVFGRGKPKNVSIANLIRFGVMVTFLPTGFALFGLPGALLALPAAEFTRYLILMRTQLKLGTTFLIQDAALSLGLVAVFGTWIAARLLLGLGVPWALIG